MSSLLGGGSYGTVYKETKGCSQITECWHEIMTEDWWHARGDTVCAVKKITDPTDEARAEVDILVELNHENIVSFWEARLSTVKSTGERILWIAMEYADAGTFGSFIVEQAKTWGNPNTLCFTEWAIFRLLRHLAAALVYLHTPRQVNGGGLECVLHRDIKPDNLLGFTQRDRDGARTYITWKLADFGIAKRVPKDQFGGYTTNSEIGTPTYMAPEVSCDL